MEITEIVLLAVSVILSLTAVILTARKKPSQSNETERYFIQLRREINSDMQTLMSQQRTEISKSNTDNITALAAVLRSSLDDSFSKQNKLLQALQENTRTQLMQFEQRMASFQKDNSLGLDSIRKTVESSLQGIREDNNKKLDEMKRTVDEKLQTELQKRMRESFQEVSALMERLQKDIGSMRTLADDVGGLTRSLTNVKTRGMMGEFQLESILREVFHTSQYEKNAHPVPDNPGLVVEFALKIPTEDDSFIYLPIDSKFPQDRYAEVIAAQESGDRASVERATANYLTELKRCADEIKKYIAPPFTTDYAIMFLPTESMYADAVNHGMLDELWKRANVYITGPSTVAALLGSMQLSFNNLAIRKSATEVFAVLKEVSAEFDKFGDVLVSMQKHLNQTDKDLNDLIGTRTKAMRRKLDGLSRISLNKTEDTNLLPEA